MHYKNDADNFSEKGKYKNNINTFFSLYFPNVLSNWKKEKVNNPYVQFGRHVNAINGVYSESMKNYLSFFNEMAGNVEPVNGQVVQTSEKTKKNNSIL